MRELRIEDIDRRIRTHLLRLILMLEEEMFKQSEMLVFERVKGTRGRALGKQVHIRNSAPTA